MKYTVKTQVKDMTNQYPVLGTSLASIGLTLAMQEADARRARDTRAAALELELRRTRDELGQAAAAAGAWKALVAAMVAEQRGYDAGERNARDLTDPANSQRRVDFVRREAASQQGRHAKRVSP